MSPQVVLLMAGRGARFGAAGYRRSKPLIQVDGRPMFVAALAGLAELSPLDVVAVVRQEQVRIEQIDVAVREAVPTARIVSLPAVTRGAAESARAACPVLDPTRPVIVLDCDLEFRSGDYLRAVGDFSQEERAALLTFPASDPRYSFAQIDSDGMVVAIAEKEVISRHAVAGAYAFSSARLFADAADTVLRGGLGASNEFYMSGLIAELLRRGVPVRAAGVDHYRSFGTPEELAASAGGQP